MTTLAETFLNDLDEEDDDMTSSEEEGGEETNAKDEGGSKGEDAMEQDHQDSAGTLSGISKLRTSKDFQHDLERVQAFTHRDVGKGVTDTFDPEYKLVIKSNKRVTEIYEEISAVHERLKEIYKDKFPELARLLSNPLQYASVVKKIGNETDMTAVDFGDAIDQSQKLVVTVTGSSAIGKRLDTEKLRAAILAADEIAKLESDRRTFLKFVESRMRYIAPNTSVIIGTTVTAKLLGYVGSLRALSMIPSCNLQVIGKEDVGSTDSHIRGFATKSENLHRGIIATSNIVKNAPAHLRKKVLRWVAAKVALAVRADTCGSASDRSNADIGYALREQIQTRIEKELAPKKRATKKALPAPDSKPKRKRGGKRQRKFKEKFAMTQIRKQQNRIIFDDRNDEYGDSAMGRTFGALGKGGVAGSLRILKTDKSKGSNKQQQRRQLMRKVGNLGSSGATSGLTSSLAFTPVQGIELPDPELQRRRARQLEEANASYFSDTASFVRTSKKQKRDSDAARRAETRQ